MQETNNNTMTKHQEIKNIQTPRYKHQTKLNFQIQKFRLLFNIEILNLFGYCFLVIGDYLYLVSW